MKVEGKKALVFGGTSGIGLATACQLRDLGAEVVAVSRDPSKHESVEGVTAVPCDVRDREALAALFAEQAPFSILVSAATGGGRALGPFLEMDMEGFAGSFDKLWGYANVVRYGAEHLTDDGSIVLVSGSPAKRPKPPQAALAAVGASVEHLCRAIARELAPKRINTVSPGIIDTPMFGPPSEERTRGVLANTAQHLIPRGGTPDEVAKAIVFCVENDFVTGTNVDVDGGWLLG